MATLSKLIDTTFFSKFCAKLRENLIAVGINSDEVKYLWNNIDITTYGYYGGFSGYALNLLDMVYPDDEETVNELFSNNLYETIYVSGEYMDHIGSSVYDYISNKWMGYNTENDHVDWYQANSTLYVVDTFKYEDEENFAFVKEKLDAYARALFKDIRYIE